MRLFRELFLFYILNVVLSSLDLFATFNSIGITTFPSTSTSSCSSIHYCVVGDSSTCKDGHELTKITDSPSDKFVGSLFYLTPNTNYEVTVTCENNQAETEQISTRAEMSLPSTWSKTLYVSPTGTGSSCSETTPCELSYAISQIVTNTRIILRGGRYFEGDYVFGDVDGPILFQGYQDEIVLLDGSTELTGLSHLSGDGVYRKADYTDIENSNVVVMIRKSDGKEWRLLNFADRTNFENLFYTSPVTGDPNWGFMVDASAGTLDINIGTLNFADYEFRYSDKSPFATIERPHYYFHNLTFQYYGYHIWKQFALDYDCRVSDHAVGHSADFGWVKHCKFKFICHPVMVRFFAQNVLVEHSEFYDSSYLFQWEGAKDYQGAEGIEGGMVGIGRIDDWPNICPGRGLVARFNVIHDVFDGFDFSGTNNDASTTVHGLQTCEYDVHNNYIYNIRDDAFEFDRLASNVRVFNNYVENMFVGVSNSNSEVGPFYAFNNVFNNLLDWTAIKIDRGSQDWQIGSMYYYHNTIYAPNGHDNNAIRLNNGQMNWDLLKLRNNVIIGDRYALTVVFPQSDQRPIDMDYNAYYYINANSNGVLIRWDADRYDSIEEYRAGEGQEANGIQLTTDDIFVDSHSLLPKKDSVVDANGVYIIGISDKDQPNIGIMFDVEKNVLPPSWEIVVSEGSRRTLVVAILCFVLFVIN